MKKYDFASGFLKDKKSIINKAVNSEQLEYFEDVFSKVMAFDHFVFLNDELLIKIEV
jgi:hypothetical protein